MELTKRQENCPCCHEPFMKMPLRGFEDENIKYSQRYKDIGSRLILVLQSQEFGDSSPWDLAVDDNPFYCQHCGRPLNTKGDR